MKKIALIAAVAAAVAAPAAFAQSSVTLWGRINTTVESQKIGNGDRVVREANNNSRLGFTGTEDLGGGMKAAFNLEHGFESDTGAASGGTQFWNRQSNVQLSGGFGTVRLGAWFPDSYFATVDRTSNHNHDTGSSADALFSSIGFSYRTNKVGYFSPDMNGFNAAVSVHAGEGVVGDARAYDASFNYQVAGLHIGGGYSQADTVAQRKNYIIEADYGFGPFLVTGYAQSEKIDGYKTRNIGRVSAMYTLGASEFHVNVGGTKAGGDTPVAKGGFMTNGAKQWTLGYNYNLSKRTKVYGYYTVIDYTTANKVGDFSSLAAGIRHNF